MTFHVETDHKSLVSLLGYEHLDELSSRVQPIRRRLMRFSYTISHVPGKDSVTPDTLSHAPIYKKVSYEEEASADDVKAYVDFALENLPTTENRLQEIREKLQQDEVCRQIMSHCENGWPEKQHVKLNEILKQFENDKHAHCKNTKQLKQGQNTWRGQSNVSLEFLLNAWI